jgi:hypothetical protein
MTALTIYFLCGAKSQKAQNIARDNRVSLTIDHDVPDPMAITGLSMAARAEPVRDTTEISKATGLLMKRFLEYAAYPASSPDQILIMKVLPKVISVLDYSKGLSPRGGIGRSGLPAGAWCRRGLAISRSGRE